MEAADCTISFLPIFLLLHQTEQSLPGKKNVRPCFSFVSQLHAHIHPLCVSWQGGSGVQSWPYLLPNLANMQVICGVATSQLSHLLSAAPNPQLAAAFPTPTCLRPPSTLTPPAATFIASLVCSACGGVRAHAPRALKP